MPTAFHSFAPFTQEALNAGSTNRYNLTSDTCKVLLVASGTFNWVTATEQYATVSAFLTNAGSGGGGALTECTGGNYSRVTMTGNSLTSAGAVTTLTFTSPSFVNVTLNTVYAMFYDYTAGGSSDTNGIPMCYWDFGGSQPITSSTFTLTISASGLITWTST